MPSAEVATPMGDSRDRAEVTSCVCGWCIIRYPDANRPTWLHLATLNPECGIDDLRRPWSAPSVKYQTDGPSC